MTRATTLIIAIIAFLDGIVSPTATPRTLTVSGCGALGGTNELDNVVISCAPCNFARMGYTLEEVGVLDPRAREPIRSDWDGLERFSLGPRSGTCREKRFWGELAG